MRVFIKLRRLSPLASFVLLAVLVAVSLGDLGGHALASSTWTSQISGTNNNLKGIVCPGASPITCFAVGANAAIVATTNGGITPWMTQTPPSGVTQDLLGIACPNTTACYAVGVTSGGGAGTILNYNGSSWVTQNGKVKQNYNGLACLNTTHPTCFVVGASGTILFENDGGSTGNSWMSQTVGSANLNGIACLSTTNCFAVGDSGTILNYNGSSWSALTNNGSNWTSQNLKGIACPGTSPITCFAVGAKPTSGNGTILFTNNGGSSWTSQNSGVAQNLNGIACLSTTNCFAVGDSGTILNYNGSSWSALTNNGSNWTSQNLKGIACPSASACFAAGDSGTILSKNASSLTETGGTASTATPVTLNGVDHTTTYTLQVTVSDTTGSGAGWNLTITSTTLTAGSHTLSTTASTINTAPMSACVGTCILPSNNVSYTSALGVPAGSPLPTAKKYFNASSGTGMGTMTVTAMVTVAIPANAFYGTYSSTLTIAIASSP